MNAPVGCYIENAPNGWNHRGVNGTRTFMAKHNDGRGEGKSVELSEDAKWIGSHEARVAGKAFLDAGYALIVRDTPIHELSPEQRQGMTIVDELCQQFAGSPNPQSQFDLQRAADKIASLTSVRMRARALANIEDAAATYHGPSVVGATVENGSEARYRIIGLLINTLIGIDPKFKALLGSRITGPRLRPEDARTRPPVGTSPEERLLVVMKLLDAWDPEAGGKAGHKDSTRILSELVVEVGGALGIVVNPSKEREGQVKAAQRSLGKVRRKKISASKSRKY